VHIRSGDPRDTPDIRFRCFEEGDGSEDALEAVVDAVLFVRDMARHYRHMIAAEERPGPQVQGREAIRRFVRNEAWGHHASGTCKIGLREDAMAVLDSRFRVHGTENLRVVDASVFPYIPGLFIVSAVYMIAEKASDVILADATGG
jgi:choline dehydrogenase